MGPLDCEQCDRLLGAYREAAARLVEAGRTLSRDADLPTKPKLDLLEMHWVEIGAATRECERIRKAIHEHLKSHTQAAGA